MAINEDPDGRRRRSIRSKKLILEAARVIFAEKSYSEITMRDLSKLAEVGYGTLYTHYKGKDDILIQLIGEINDDFSKLIHRTYDPKSVDDVERSIQKQLSCLLKLARKHKPLLKVAYEALGESKKIQFYWEQVFQNYTDKAMADYNHSVSIGLARPDLDKRIVAKTIVSLMKEFFWSVVLEKETNINVISKNVTAIFLTGAYIHNS